MTKTQGSELHKGSQPSGIPFRVYNYFTEMQIHLISYSLRHPNRKAFLFDYLLISKKNLLKAIVKSCNYLAKEDLNEVYAYVITYIQLPIYLLIHRYIYVFICVRICIYIHMYMYMYVQNMYISHICICVRIFEGLVWEL